MEEGDAEGARKKGKKCKKGGDKDGDKPEAAEEAQEDAEEAAPADEEKPERKERPAKDGEGEDDEDKPRRRRKCLADAAGEVADELGLTEQDKEDLKAAFEEGDWEGFEEGAEIVGDENAMKLFEKLDEAEKEFDGDEAEGPKRERRSKDEAADEEE